jgi:hypothetical protein
MGAVAKSYMRKGFLIYEEMRKYLVIYDFATNPFWISLHLRKICFLFYQCDFCQNFARVSCGLYTSFFYFSKKDLR